MPTDRSHRRVRETVPEKPAPVRPKRSTQRDARSASEPLAHFGDRLAGAMDAAGSVACIGLDPVIDRLPSAILRDAKLPGQAEKIEAFCIGVLDAAKEAGGIGAIKPQSACFERYGAAGMRALKAVIRAARQRGFIVILDAKRGDIGISAEHYAASAFGAPGESPPHAADALTLNPYLGPDTLEPYLGFAGRGVFVLVRTSNPGSDELQSARLADGRSVAEMVAQMVANLGAPRRGARGLSDMGAVVGATKSAEGVALRACMPDAFILVPGYGTQGGSLEDVRTLVRAGARSAGDLGVVVNAGRSVLYPANAGSDWRTGVREAARAFVADIQALNP